MIKLDVDLTPDLEETLEAGDFVTRECVSQVSGGVINEHLDVSDNVQVVTLPETKPVSQTIVVTPPSEDVGTKGVIERGNGCNQAQTATSRTVEDGHELLTLGASDSIISKDAPKTQELAIEAPVFGEVSSSSPNHGTNDGRSLASMVTRQSSLLTPQVEGIGSLSPNTISSTSFGFRGEDTMKSTSAICHFAFPTNNTFLSVEGERTPGSNLPPIFVQLHEVTEDSMPKVMTTYRRSPKLSSTSREPERMQYASLPSRSRVTLSDMPDSPPFLDLSLLVAQAALLEEKLETEPVVPSSNYDNHSSLLPPVAESLQADNSVMNSLPVPRPRYLNDNYIEGTPSLTPQSSKAPWRNTFHAGMQRGNKMSWPSEMGEKTSMDSFDLVTPPLYNSPKQRTPSISSTSSSFWSIGKSAKKAISRSNTLVNKVFSKPTRSSTSLSLQCELLALSCVQYLNRT